MKGTSNKREKTSDWQEFLRTPFSPLKRCSGPHNGRLCVTQAKFIWHLCPREYVQTLTGFQGSHYPHVLWGFLIGVWQEGAGSSWGAECFWQMKLVCKKINPAPWHPASKPERPLWSWSCKVSRAQPQLFNSETEIIWRNIFFCFGFMWNLSRLLCLLPLIITAHCQICTCNSDLKRKALKKKSHCF